MLAATTTGSTAAQARAISMAAMLTRDLDDIPDRDPLDRLVAGRDMLTVAALVIRATPDSDARGTLANAGHDYFRALAAYNGSAHVRDLDTAVPTGKLPDEWMAVVQAAYGD
ncbi:hypothetical protein [Prescottella subtropica]|uniref:hypothetical protein n=1 Tax=Prescottella subtropica TaxID=2545757 RepID=UPI0010F899FA|nr:hypothetical protein [Prescottella subtropica]